MGDQPVSQVDTFALARIGSAVERSAAAFATAHSSRAEVLTIAGSSAGWAAEPVLDAAVRTWGAFLTHLSEQVGTLGADLTAAAGEFREADAAAGHRIDVAGHSPVRLF